MEYNGIIYKISEETINRAYAWVSLVGYTRCHLSDDPEISTLELAREMADTGNTGERAEELIHSWASQYQDYQVEMLKK